MGRLRRRCLLRVGLGLLVVAVLLQLVPLGRAHPNPPVRQDAPWPDGRTRELAMTACYDCHSNQTRWPPQSFVAPFSWLIARDVKQGRAKLNFSDWAEDADEATDAADAVTDGSMPPTRYVLVHPGARLGQAERRLLADTLAAMRADGGNGGSGGGDS
jgi:Haem-binding domain